MKYIVLGKQEDGSKVSGWKRAAAGISAIALAIGAPLVVAFAPYVAPALTLVAHVVHIGLIPFVASLPGLLVAAAGCIRQGWNKIFASNTSASPTPPSSTTPENPIIVVSPQVGPLASAPAPAPAFERIATPTSFSDEECETDSPSSWDPPRSATPPRAHQEAQPWPKAAVTFYTTDTPRSAFTRIPPRPPIGDAFPIASNTQ